MIPRCKKNTISTNAFNRLEQKLHKTSRNERTWNWKNMVPTTSTGSKSKQTAKNSMGGECRFKVSRTCLLTGPDLFNRLLGILLRFREHPVAILADIAIMFMQFSVQSTLHFLCSKNNFIIQYQFTRFIFGANCLPSRAIILLNQCAKDNAESFPELLQQ